MLRECFILSAFSQKEEQAHQDIKQIQGFSEGPTQEGKLLKSTGTLEGGGSNYCTHDGARFARNLHPFMGPGREPQQHHKARLFPGEQHERAGGEWVPRVPGERGTKGVPGTTAAGQPAQRRGQHSLPKERSQQAYSVSENSIRFKLRAAQVPKYAAGAPWEKDSPFLGRQIRREPSPTLFTKAEPRSSFQICSELALASSRHPASTLRPCLYLLQFSPREHNRLMLQAFLFRNESC